MALSFIELILHDRNDLIEGAFDLPDKSLASLLYIKFRFNGENYQTKFVSLESENASVEDRDRNASRIFQTSYSRALNLLCLDIQKTILLPLDLSDQDTIEQAFGTPLEIQLWHKVAAKQPYKQPDSENLIGTFYVELNELPKTLNTRVKGSQH